MLSLILDEVASSAQPVAPSKLDFDADAPVRSLARNELLFEAGDLKTGLYRVEAGVLRIYTARPGAEPDVVEYALAGDLVGMGFLERHAVTLKKSPPRCRTGAGGRGSRAAAMDTRAGLA